MNQPIVYIGAALVLMAIGFIVGRITAGMDRKAAGELASKLKRIEDTRGTLQSYLQVIEATASGDGGYLSAVNAALERNPFPRFDGTLIVDDELLIALPATGIEVARRGFGQSRDVEWVQRIAHFRSAINRAMDAQEALAISGKDLATITVDQAAQLRGNLEPLLHAFDSAWRPTPAGEPARHEEDPPPA